MSSYNYTYRYGNVKRYSKQSNKETPTFAEEVMLLLESNGITSGQSFETSIYLGRNIYLKLKKDKNYIPSENAAYTICIALKLSLYETMNLLNKAGYSIMPRGKDDLYREVLIRMILDQFSYIPECNKELKNLGLQELGSIES